MIRYQNVFAMRLYSQAHTYPMTHDMPTTMTNVTRDATEGVAFGSSAATVSAEELRVEQKLECAR